MWLLVGDSCSPHVCNTGSTSFTQWAQNSVWNWKREGVERDLDREGWKVLRGRFVQNTLRHV